MPTSSPPTIAASPASATPPLGRRFLTVWAGQSISGIGSVVSGVGVGVYVYIETGSAAWLGVLSALASLPYVLTAPLLPLTDRYRRRSVMIAADTFAVLGPTIALLLALTNRLEVWHLVVAGFAGGIGNSFQVPASQASIPALVAPEVVDRANGLSQLGAASSIVVGPAVATALVAWWGIAAVLFVDLATFLVAVAATLSVRFDDATDEAGVVDDRTWGAAWSWLWGAGRPLVTILAVTASANFLLAFFNVSVLVLATDLGGTARAGLVLAITGTALIAGSLVIARRGVSADRVKMVSSGLVTVGIGFVIAAARPSLVVLVLGILLAFTVVPAINATTSTIFHERTPASMQGRIFGLRSALGRSCEPIGSIVAGFAIASVGAPAMRSGGVLGSSIGRLIGSGETRGAALVIAVVGIVLAATGLWLRTSPIRAQLRRDEEPDTSV